jgi:predicted ATP-grasp superfamily ATP-dependent carboligase
MDSTLFTDIGLDSPRESAPRQEQSTASRTTARAESGMPVRLLITGAGSGPSNNLIRSLKAGDPSLFIAGCHSDRFILKTSAADRNFLVHSATHRAFLRDVARVIARVRVDLLIPTTDADVRALSRARRRLPCRVFLPSRPVVELCQDKYRLSRFLRGRGVAAPLTYAVRSLAGVPGIFRRLGRTPLWCRVRAGSGSTAAIPVRAPRQAQAWIAYWSTMRGIPVRSFTLSEYLPGRDFGCQSLWDRGRPVLTKAFQRLSYIAAGGHPSGVSSVAALARTAADSRVQEVTTRAVGALGRDVSGLFSVDLKEDGEGTVCVTEINAGRFLAGTNLLDLTGKHNMATTYVQLALGERVESLEEPGQSADYYMVRDVDTLPAVFHAEEFFSGIEDARN